MTLSAAWRRQLLPVPGLSADWISLPPKSLVIDGSERRFARDVDLHTAELLADRGVPVFVISFDASGRLPGERLSDFLAANRRAFQDAGEHGAEALVRIYGRRRGREDQRVLAVVFVA